MIKKQLQLIGVFIFSCRIIENIQRNITEAAQKQRLTSSTVSSDINNVSPLDRQATQMHIKEIKCHDKQQYYFMQKGTLFNGCILSLLTKVDGLQNWTTRSLHFFLLKFTFRQNPISEKQTPNLKSEIIFLEHQEILHLFECHVHQQTPRTL